MIHFNSCHHGGIGTQTAMLMFLLSTCRILCRSTAAEERTSLIPETLQELSLDKEQQALNERLQVEGQAVLSKEERRRRQRSLDSIGAPSFQQILKARLSACSRNVQAFKICIMQPACHHCRLLRIHAYQAVLLDASPSTDVPLLKLSCYWLMHFSKSCCGVVMRAVNALQALPQVLVQSCSTAQKAVSCKQEHNVRPLRRDLATTLQLNIGLYCNQACTHCHVESSPLRKEMMDRQTAERCMALLKASKGSVRTLDLTGGAPELNSQFRSVNCSNIPPQFFSARGLHCFPKDQQGQVQDCGLAWLCSRAQVPICWQSAM